MVTCEQIVHHSQNRLRLNIFFVVFSGISLALITLTGCQTPHVAVLEEDIMQQYLPFIRDGAISREEVLLNLGTPSSQFEEDQILTYAFDLDYNGDMHMIISGTRMAPPYCTWNPKIYSLVLVFDSNGVLKKHSLVGSR